MLRGILKLALLVGLIHIGLTMATPHIANRLLSMKVKEIARENHLRSEQYVQNEILGYASDKRIPLELRDLRVWRQNGNLRIWIDYDRKVSIPYRPYYVDLMVVYPAGTQPPGVGAGRGRRR